MELTQALDLDEFRLVRVLGQGGMGAVYLGYDTVLERDVAIKVMRERPDDEGGRLRFLTEARAIARLDHPNVIAIYRAATTRDGHPYIVQELVRGESLDRFELPLAPPRILELALGIARGLAAAHRRGILHRDIKPANVMVDDTGTPKLLDFGVAKLAGTAAVPGPRAKPVTPGVAETFDDRPAEALATTADADGASRPTVVGGVVGTPRYLAPEIWRGEPASPRSDIYSFGVLLYELAAGEPPFPQTDRAALEAAVTGGAGPPPLAARCPALDPDLAAIATACHARDPAARPESLDEIVHRIERIVAGAPALPEGNPYPGLAPFTAEQRAVFFGRGSDISTIVDRLRADPLVVVAGDSGIGKSSLCRAGVIPAIAAGALGDARTWTARVIALGRTAVAALRECLGPAPELGAAELARALGVTATTGTLIVIDQCEELVTLNDHASAVEAASLIAELARGIPGIKVLVTVRGDFLTRLAALPRLGPVLTRSLHLLRVLSLADAREAVVGPARAKQVRFETPAMVEALATSVADQPGALPLLSFALAELWQRRDPERAVIPAAALDAIGGVAGALARHADAVVGSLARPERTAARRIALLLVTRDATRDARARRELCPDDDPAATAALEAMVRGRLVVARNTASGEASYELAHDSMIVAWATLRGWRDDIAGQARLRTRLAAAADEWRRLGRPRDALYTRAQLAEVAALDDLAASDRAFVTASRRALRRRRAVAVAFALAIPAVAATTWLVGQRRTAAARDKDVAAHVDRATAAIADAESARDRAGLDAEHAFAEFDLGTKPARRDAEAVWQHVLGSRAAAHDAYAAALDELALALSLDGTRADVRAQLAHTLLARAELAEAEGDADSAISTAARIAAFDDTGEATRAWHRNAKLVVRAIGAEHVTVARYRDRDGMQELAPAHAIDASAQELEPGSYLVELAAGDRRVRVPVVLGRGEPLTLTIALPARIPAGMVYIPAGRFLSGSTSEAILRQAFLGAAPLHTRTTPAYLIGRTEVTFADWMAFLRALPAAKRELHRPRVRASTGSITVLGSESSAFSLTFAAHGSTQSVPEGKPLVLAGRDRRREVRWENAPVIGISYDDAIAYATWLRTTGRLPGARLCTDLEWERAARGADGRTWAHGERILEPGTDVANIDVSYHQKSDAFGPDEVGSHPASDSPFGLADTEGNAWEWVRGVGDVALRGGGWYYGQSSAIAANRDGNPPDARQWFGGLRVCAEL